MKPFQCLFDDPFVLLLLLWNAKVVTESPQLPVSRTYATTFPPKLSQKIVVSYKCQDKIHSFRRLTCFPPRFIRLCQAPFSILRRHKYVLCVAQPKLANNRNFTELPTFPFRFFVSRAEKKYATKFELKSLRLMRKKKK